MSIFRNLTWWFTGLSTLVVFILVLLLSELLQGQFWIVPTSAIITVYVGLFFGLVNKASFLRLGETLVHEIGHAQMSALTFGRVSFIRVERDTSGVTYHKQGFLFKRLTSALISLCGPISSAVMFLITARLVASELTAYWAMGSSFFIILILVTTVRNLWGWITGLTLFAILYLILEATGFVSPQILGTENLVTTNTILVNVILGIVAFNAGSALKYSLNCRFPRNPNSDEARFARALFLPGSVGGHLIILIQVGLIWIGIGYLLGWSTLFSFERFI